VPLAIHDDTRWPLIIVRMPTGSMTAADFDAHLQRLVGHLQRREPHGLVIDMGDCDLNGENRRQLADHYRLHAAEVREHLRAVAMVVYSPIHRAMYRAIHALLGSPYPLRSFASFDEAEAWVSQVVRSSRPPPAGPGDLQVK
jgi:hypothetical protein